MFVHDVEHTVLNGKERSVGRTASRSDCGELVFAPVRCASLLLGEDATMMASSLQTPSSRTEAAAQGPFFVAREVRTGKF